MLDDKTTKTSLPIYNVIFLGAAMSDSNIHPENAGAAIAILAIGLSTWGLWALVRWTFKRLHHGR